MVDQPLYLLVPADGSLGVCQSGLHVLCRTRLMTDSSAGRVYWAHCHDQFSPCMHALKVSSSVFSVGAGLAQIKPGVCLTWSDQD